MQLPYWSSNVDFIELRESAQLIGAPLFVPELVAKEIVQRRIETASDQLRKLKEISSGLGTLLNRKPLEYEKVERINEIITVLTGDFLTHIGIEVIPTPANISVQKLIDMAVRREAPFQGSGEKGERGDKGFKDTIILFTIIDHMESSSIKDAVFLTFDSIFSSKDLTSRLQNQGLNLFIAKSFKEATEYINKNIDNLVKQHIEEESKKIKEFLEDNFDYVTSFIVDNVEISEQFLKPTGLLGAFLSDHSLDNVSIIKILKITPKSITSAKPGLIDKDEPKVENAKAITFTVSLQFNLLVQEYGFGIFGFESKKFPISTPEAYEELKARPFLGEPRIMEKTVLRDITIDAYIHLKDGEYNKLEISKANTY
jgi:hypothetical protein